MEKWIKRISVVVTIFDVIFMLMGIFCAICNIMSGNVIGAVNGVLMVIMAIAFISILWDCK